MDKTDTSQQEAPQKNNEYVKFIGYKVDVMNTSASDSEIFLVHLPIGNIFIRTPQRRPMFR
jgi:hypothetical protein